MKLEDQFFIQWFQKAVETWGFHNFPIPKNVLSFTANLTACLIKRQQFFINLNSTHHLEVFIKIMRSTPESTQCSQIKISYLNLMSSFLQHSSGLYCLIETNYWFDVMTLAAHDCEQEIGKKGVAFLLELLRQSNRINPKFFKTVIETILSPLRDVAVSCSKSKDVSMIETIPMKEFFSLLNNILMALIEHSCKMRDFTVLSLFTENFEIEKNLTDIVSVAENKDSIVMLNTSLLLFCFSCLVRDWAVGKGNEKKSWLTIEKLNDLIADMVVRCKPYHNFLTIIQKSLLIGNYYYVGMHASTGSKDEKGAEMFQYQFVICLVWPVVNIMTRNTNCFESDELRQDLYVKFLRNTHSVTLKNLRRIKDSIKSSTLEDATKALEYIQKCSPLLCHNVANTVAQCLIYQLKDSFTEPDNIQKENYLTQNYIEVFIETLIVLLKTFDLTWKDSVETLYVTDIAINCLSHSFWMPKVRIEIFLIYLLTQNSDIILGTFL